MLTPLRIVPMLRLELSADEPGPATHVRVAALILAVEEPLEVRGIRSGAAPGEESLLDLRVSWTDFPGDRAVSTGQGTTLLLPAGAGGTASPGAPLVLEHELELPAADGLLARRIEVDGRLIGVDLVRGEVGHTGGTMLDLPHATLETFAPGPDGAAGTLDENLQSGSAAGIFLSAAGAPPERREWTIARLVDALPALSGPARQAAFAALLYLTGETNGLDIHRWRIWWKERLQAREGR